MNNNICTIAKRKKLKQFLKNAALFVFISILIYAVFSAYQIYAFGQIDERTNADAAIILGASAWHDKPSPVFQERINHGIWLYQNGFVKYLIFTGGFGKNAEHSEAEVAKNYAIKDFVPVDKIFIEEESTITIENFFYAKKIVVDNQFDKIIVVSDPLHMKRAMTIAQDYGLNVYSSPTPTTKYISWKTKIDFLFYETFFYVAYNIQKYFYVIIFYLFVFECLIIVYLRKILH
jgi:uncharacterized SAM-binding protein YcdF (DUF218 family)